MSEKITRESDPEPTRAGQPASATALEADTGAGADPAGATEGAPQSDGDARSGPGWVVGGLGVLLLLAIATWYLTEQVPEWTSGTALADVGGAIEFPVYAIVLGLLANWVLSASGLRERLAGGFRTELFIKIGLVLLGASVDLGVIGRAAGPAILQSLVLVSAVFAFTWWFAGKLGLDAKLRALLASALSICGVSAAIAAAGAVNAKKEQLAYAASLVIVFALPSIFLLPWLAGQLGLSPAVTGAWIGGNIDTTAAVTAAGTLAGEEALEIAAIVKSTQNALIGFVAVALTAYFALRIERVPGGDSAAQRSGWLKQIWQRFPKFVLGFVLASVIATLYLSAVGSDAGRPVIGVANDLRTWFFTLAFVSIGLEFRVSSLRSAGARPVLVFAAGTLLNILLALGIASLVFASFEA